MPANDSTSRILPVVPRELLAPRAARVRHHRAGDIREPFTVAAAPPASSQVDPWGDPYDERLLTIAKQFDLVPKDLDWHVEAIHGYAPHNEGYAEALVASVRCLQNGTCE